jgi:DNA adenine methylase
MGSNPKGPQMPPRPFLRWAGGKSRFVQEIISRLPVLPPNATYFEPFLGAGAVFLAYAPNRAVISDLNPDLVLTFKTVKCSPSAKVRHIQAQS